MISSVSLGQLTAKVCAAARWRGQDEFPAWQVWADEVEELLRFAVSAGQFDRFFSRLTASRTQRDEALEELRVALFFYKNGFPITAWEPPGAGGTVEEFCLGTPGSPDTFVEVKSPGWESELSAQEIAAGRPKQEKHRHIEGRAVAPWQSVRAAIRKAYPKFTATGPNLLVIADDLFVNLTEWGDLPANMALYANHTRLDGEAGCFAGSAFENLGGLGLFCAKPMDSGVQYVFRLYDNPKALRTVELPKEFKRDEWRESETAKTP
jgi:hypothetical protein